MRPHALFDGALLLCTAERSERGAGLSRRVSAAETAVQPPVSYSRVPRVIASLLCGRVAHPRAAIASGNFIAHEVMLAGNFVLGHAAGRRVDPREGMVLVARATALCASSRCAAATGVYFDMLLPATLDFSIIQEDYRD